MNIKTFLLFIGLLVSQTADAADAHQMPDSDLIHREKPGKLNPAYQAFKARLETMQQLERIKPSQQTSTNDAGEKGIKNKRRLEDNDPSIENLETTFFNFHISH